MAAEDFLRQLREVEPEATLNNNRCCICMEPYGTPSADNGNAEHGVRLPCSHIVGSHCIATWLSPHSFNNTCPYCRQILFPTPPRIILQAVVTEADLAILRIAHVSNAWGIHDLRAWLRRRLELNPPSTTAEVDEWWDHRAVSGQPRLESTETSEPIRRQVFSSFEEAMYARFLDEGFDLPPLMGSGEEEDIWPLPNRIDRHHENALFHVLDSTDVFDHIFWQVTSPHASSREIFDLLRQEGYLFGGNGRLLATSLASWGGLRREGDYGLPVELNEVFSVALRSTTPEEEQESQSEEVTLNEVFGVALNSTTPEEEQESQSEEVTIARPSRRTNRRNIIDSDDEEPDPEEATVTRPSRKAHRRVVIDSDDEESNARPRRRGKRNVVVDSDDE